LSRVTQETVMEKIKVLMADDSALIGDMLSKTVHSRPDHP